MRAHFIGILAALGAASLLGACGKDERLGRLEPGEGGAPPAGDVAPGAPARYVFLFIGDGMASVQVRATEAYLAAIEEPDEVAGSVKAKALRLSRLPVRGIQVNSSNNSLITDSASAGTAIASGEKTNDAVIGLDPTLTRSLPSIAEVAKAAGRKVGIVTSVSLDHGTPASFYAHVPSRNDFHDIGHALVASGFDYFGGGGLLDPDGTAAGVTPRGNVLDAALAAGYAVADSREEFEALAPGTPAIAMSPALDDRLGLFYEIDRVRADDPAHHLSLAELTEKGVALLHSGSGVSAGFFLMVEAGKIDWACHDNDARTTIGEVLALDDAVSVALDFMAQHPHDTLIVVTGDHETGGLSLGYTGTGYGTALEVLAGQQVSFLDLDQRVAALKDAGEPPPALADGPLDEVMLELFGLDYATLSDLERERVDAAYAREMFGTSANTAEEDWELYGGHHPFSVIVTRIVANRAGIGWTSFMHTAAPVPVLAGGADAEAFAGQYENTEIAHRLADAMELTLPD
ncbi:MAG TPA: alkaline phosphatase [Polyangiaceae bacterium]|nr:alkaline phosphatase [Polyangiaceae bacterium]